MMCGRGKSELSHSSCQAGEQARATGRGTSGAKGGGQRACGPANHVPGHRTGKASHVRVGISGEFFVSANSK